jgi:hypothetical protein
MWKSILSSEDFLLETNYWFQIESICLFAVHSWHLWKSRGVDNFNMSFVWFDNMNYTCKFSEIIAAQRFRRIFGNLRLMSVYQNINFSARNVLFVIDNITFLDNAK